MRSSFSFVIASMVVALAAAAEPTCSFSMSICPADGRGADTEILATEMRTFQDCTTNGVGTMVWRGHAVAGEDFSVTAILTPDGFGGRGYALSYSGVTNGFSVSEDRKSVV